MVHVNAKPAFANVKQNKPSFLPAVLVSGGTTAVGLGYAASTTNVAATYKLWANTRDETFHALSETRTGYGKMSRRKLEKNFLGYKKAEKTYQSLIQNLSPSFESATLDDSCFDQCSNKAISKAETDRNIAKFAVGRDIDSVLLGEHNALLKKELVHSGYLKVEEHTVLLTGKTSQSPRDYRFMTYVEKTGDTPTHYAARVGDAKDFERLSDANAGLREKLPIDKIKKMAETDRAEAGIPRHFNAFSAGNEAAHYAQFEAGKAPTYLVNNFRGAKQFLDFDSANPFAGFEKLDKKHISLAQSSGVDWFEKGKVIFRQWEEAPATRAGLGDSLSTLKLTAEFDHKFGRVLSFTVKPFNFIQKHAAGCRFFGAALVAGALIYGGSQFLTQKDAA